MGFGMARSSTLCSWPKIAIEAHSTPIYTHSLFIRLLHYYVSWKSRVCSAKGSATGGSAVQALAALKLNIGDADTAKKLSCTGSYTCIIACDTEL
jgi:hypothetical protein